MGLISDLRKTAQETSVSKQLTVMLVPQTTVILSKPSASKKKTNGFRIIAVADADWPLNISSLVFNPASTQTERSDAVDSISWSNLVDERERNKECPSSAVVKEIDLLDGIL